MSALWYRRIWSWWPSWHHRDLPGIEHETFGFRERHSYSNAPWLHDLIMEDPHDWHSKLQNENSRKDLHFRLVQYLDNSFESQFESLGRTNLFQLIPTHEEASLIILCGSIYLSNCSNGCSLLAFFSCSYSLTSATFDQT